MIYLLKLWLALLAEDSIWRAIDNNHDSIIEFKDRWIIIYHQWVRNDPVHQRQLGAEYLHFNEDGSIRMVRPTDAGVNFVENQMVDRSPQNPAPERRNSTAEKGDNIPSPAIGMPSVKMGATESRIGERLLRIGSN